MIVADRQLSSLRSNTQRRIQVLRVPQAPVLLHVAGRPKPVMGDAEVKDQAPSPGLIPLPRVSGSQEPLACRVTDIFKNGDF